MGVASAASAAAVGCVVGAAAAAWVAAGVAGAAVTSARAAAGAACGASLACSLAPPPKLGRVIPQPSTPSPPRPATSLVNTIAKATAAATAPMRKTSSSLPGARRAPVGGASRMNGRGGAQLAQRSERVANRRELAETDLERRIGGQGLLDDRGLVLVELTVKVGGELLVPDRGHVEELGVLLVPGIATASPTPEAHHSTSHLFRRCASPGSSPDSISSWRKRARARLSRDFTVPSGASTASATSS